MPKKKKKQFKNKNGTQIIPVPVKGLRPRVNWFDELAYRAPRELTREQQHQ